MPKKSTAHQAKKHKKLQLGLLVSAAAWRCSMAKVAPCKGCCSAKNSAVLLAAARRFAAWYALMPYYALRCGAW